jgi:hypothetical protein
MAGAPESRRKCLAFLGAALAVLAGCGATQYTGRNSTLRPAEQALLRRAQPAGGFLRLWRLSPGFPELGLLKWADGNPAPNPGSQLLLETIREELGRVNQAERRGDEVWVTVTIVRDERRGFFRRRRLAYELVGRTQAGTLLWTAFDEIEPEERARTGLADSDELLFGREITRKLQSAFAL